jgi:SnoaL-like protein
MGNAELRELLDHREIAQLVDQLGLWLDEKRFDEARSILTEDATAETQGGTARGLEAVVEQARRNHGEEVGTQHVITNKVIDLEGDRATAGANLIATFFDPGRPSAPRRQLGERYDFEVVRTPDGWRISSVKTTPFWMLGETPQPPRKRPDGGQ